MQSRSDCEYPDGEERSESRPGSERSELTDRGMQSRSDCEYPDCLFSQVVACLILCYMVVFRFSRTPCVPPFTALMLVTGLGLVVFWMTLLSVAREVWSALVPSQWV